MTFAVLPLEGSIHEQKITYQKYLQITYFSFTFTVTSLKLSKKMLTKLHMLLIITYGFLFASLF